MAGKNPKFEFQKLQIQNKNVSEMHRRLCFGHLNF